MRRLKDQLDGGKSQSLPGSSYSSGSNSWNPLQQQSAGGFRDGSAASIHTPGRLQRTWRRASVPTRVTWVACVGSILMVWLGYRWIRFAHAGIVIACHSVTCELAVTPVGWGRKVKIFDVNRRQLVNAVALKTTKNGSFATDQNIVLTDSFAGKVSKYNKISTYKGPDENGHYFSYGIILEDMQTRVSDPTADEESRVPDADLKLLLPYMDEIRSADNGVTQYRLIPRRFGVQHHKRRVRTSVAKFEGYIKRRRQKLVVHETAPPAWQGVVLIVFGAIGLLISLMLGQFQDPVVHRGPGVRRQQQHQQQSVKKRDLVNEAYQPATPPQFEVSTASRPAQAAASTSGYRRTSTQARKRAS